MLYSNFYYRPGPFISISGMLYRMKQHATGLANISILSVMIIIAVSTTVTLYVGTEESLNNRFPEENNMTLHTPYEMTGSELGRQVERLEKLIAEETSRMQFEINPSIMYRYIALGGQLNNQEFQLFERGEGGQLPTMATLIPLEDFNRVANESYKLDENELLVRTAGMEFNSESLTLGGQSFAVSPLEELPFFLDANLYLVETLIIVVPSVEVIDEILKNYEKNPDNLVSYWQANLSWGLEGPEENRELYAEKIHSLTNANDLDVGIFYESRSGNREEWYSMNGGFLFLGIFLGGLFTIGSVLITYFKQVSEGFEDRERIQIMQKVGLDKATTRKATSYQLIWMFSLPLLVAILHTIFAFPILQKMLVLFGITSPSLLLFSTATVILVYALIYWVIYRITSKIYLNIVE